MSIETRLDVSEEIQKKTTECRHDFSCLSGSTDCLCDVESSISDKLLFIKPRVDTICNYKLSFGYKFICNCPTRSQVYASYKM